MPKCPNCGQETQRTEDWACQWCGYPLLSGGYKKIDKTWKQIKEERGEAQPSGYEGPAQAPPPVEDTSQGAQEAKSRRGKKPVPSSRPVEEPSPASEMEEIAEPPPVAKPEKIPQPTRAPQPAPSAEVEPLIVRPEVVPEIKDASEPAARIEAEPVSAPVPEPVIETALALTVDELLATYMVNDTAAHERFTNKILRVTGIVNKVAVNDTRAVYSVFLTGKEIAGFRDLECRFTRQHATLINQLKAGQSVTIQGRYFGYVINIILRNCVLVS